MTSFILHNDLKSTSMVTLLERLIQRYTRILLVNMNMWNYMSWKNLQAIYIEGCMDTVKITRTKEMSI